MVAERVTGSWADGAVPDEILHPGRVWGAVVVGAGPAGAITARGLAGEGMDVLLLDRDPFPRWKVCGACLSPGAQGVLEMAGLGHLPSKLGARRLEGLRLRGWRRSISLPLKGTVALSRMALDTALVTEARESGCVFLAPARARWDGVTDRGAHLRVDHPQGAGRVTAKVVVAADGLRSGLMAAAGLRDTSRARSGPSSGPGGDGMIGLGALFRGGNERYPPGVIHMVVGRLGYVGVVVTEEGDLNVAAAVRGSALARAGEPARIIGEILDEAGSPALNGDPVEGWRGTPAMGYRPGRLGGERILAVGDAAGFVEPFTGEGMSWALAGGLALTPLAAAGARRWRSDLPGIWEETHRKALIPAQRLSRVMAWGLKRSTPVRFILYLLSVFPGLAGPLVDAAATPPFRHPPPLRGVS